LWEIRRATPARGQYTAWRGLLVLQYFAKKSMKINGLRDLVAGDEHLRLMVFPSRFFCGVLLFRFVSFAGVRATAVTWTVHD
jgi:hypothetical protein